MTKRSGFYKIWLWCIPIFCVAWLAYYMLVDDDLNPAIMQIQSEFNSLAPIENNGEVYRLGMWVDFADDPFKVGKQIVDQARLADGVISTEVIDAVYPPENWLADISVDERTSEFFCSLHKPDCLQFIWDNSELITPLINKYQQYVKRYEGLMLFDTFIPLSIPSFRETQNFSELYQLSVQLKIIRAIATFKSDNKLAAIEELTQILRFERQNLSSTKLITKIISLVQYESTLQSAAFLLAKTPKSDLILWQPTLNIMSPFEPEILSMRTAYRRETAIFANEAAIGIESQWESSAPITQLKPFAKLLYKPNKTLNEYYTIMMESSDTVSLQNDLFIIKETNHVKTKWYNRSFNNVLGAMLLSVAAPRFINIETNLYEADYMQRLFRLSFSAKTTGKPIQLDTVVSPHTGEAAFLAKSLVCLAGDNSPNDDICLYKE